MGSRHVDLNLEDLRSEQENIDKLIESLISFNPPCSSSSSQQLRRDSVINTSQTPVRGRGPGRPRTTRATSVTRTPSSPSPATSENSMLAAVLECLNKINVQNKRLLDFVEVISEKVDSNRSPNPEPNGSSEVQSGVSANSQQNSIDSVNERLEKIEQNINVNTLICRGPAVEDLIKNSTAGDLPNLERLKGEICTTACGEDVTGIDISHMQVTVFGKEKKCVKIKCPNPVSKLHLLKKSRTRKPEGFFVSEFLTATKLKVFHNLRALKRQHPLKIKSVFTRSGNILYTLHNSNRVYQASSLSELTNVIGTDLSEGSSTIV